MFYVCVARFDVTENLKNFRIFFENQTRLQTCIQYTPSILEIHDVYDIIICLTRSH